MLGDIGGMENIKDLLKEHLRIEVIHPRELYHEYQDCTEVLVYFDDELITKDNNIDK